MKSVFLMIGIFSLSLMACGRTCTYHGVQVPGPTQTVTVQVPADGVDNIASVVARENKTRFSEGQWPLTQGLVCSLSTVPANTPQIAGTSLTYIASWTYQDTFNIPNGPVSDGFPVLPLHLQPVYMSWYVVRCSGQLVIVNDDFYNFSLASDDGAIVNIDGLSLNNDGNHSVTTVTGGTFLRNGVHSFDLYFMQGPAGYQALILNMNGVPVPSANLFH